MNYHASWQSPSNIALVKYWGKHGVQLPRNPSLSFTLARCLTKMSVEVNVDAASPGLTVMYDGQPRPAFEAKILTFFNLVGDRFPWLRDAHVRIDSVNTFPHGAGIASSASAMSALALCLMDIRDQAGGPSGGPEAGWWQEVSEVSRLGSGSACRSVFPAAAIWGQADAMVGSHDTYAIPWGDKIDPLYRDFRDTILIVSGAEKAVSSTAGHALMNDLAYAETRYAEARRHLHILADAMSRADALDTFITVCESEALQLHALMMSGPTPFILMEPGTVAIIKEVWRYRKATGIPVCFTLDAGPNVHLLYPNAHAGEVMDWVRDVLVRHCADGQYIEDHVGVGPQRLAG